MKRKWKAIALILVVAMMGVLSLMGIYFVQTNILDQRACQNYFDRIQVKMLSDAGMHYAVGKLKERYRFTSDAFYPNELYDSAVIASEREWMFWKADSDPYWKDNLKICGTSTLEDDIGAGVQIEELDDTENSYPSFYGGNSIGGRRVSKLWKTSETGEKYTFTLKIFDTTSQINLNMHINPDDTILPRKIHPELKEGITTDETIPMSKILNSLSEAIARLSWYTENGKRNLKKGPLRGLGSSIMKKRRELGEFTSKLQLIDITDGSETITEDDVYDIWDFITVYPGTAQFKENPCGRNNLNPYQTLQGYRKILTSDPFHQRDHRSPVNINTASWPVLVAIFQYLSMSKYTVTREQAEELATRVCQYRRDHGSFTTHDDWHRFLYNEQQAKRIFYQDPFDIVDIGQQKITVVSAMTNINTTGFGLGDELAALQRFYPDQFPLRYASSAKRYVEFQTTEICFYPYGMFEILCLAEIWNQDNILMAKEKVYSVVKIYDLLLLNTQSQFYNSQTQNWDSKVANNAFAHTNNIQTPSPLFETSLYYGSVMPVLAKSSQTDIKYSSGNLSLISLEFLRLRADFNGTLEVDYAKNNNLSFLSPRIPSWAAARGVRNLVALRNNYIEQYGDIWSDGLLEWACYLCYDAGKKVDDLYPFQEEDNINLPITQGTLSFWFKLDDYNHWIYSFVRTIFFTTSYRSYLNGCQDGIQMEIAMKVQPFDKNLVVQARRKYYQKPEASSDYDLDRCEYEYIDHCVMARFYYSQGYGVRTNEWYQLTVRWQDGTKLGGFDNGPALILSGNFYGKDQSGKEVVTVSGPALSPSLYQECCYDLLSSSYLLNPGNPNLSFPKKKSELNEENKKDCLGALEENETSANPSKIYVGGIAKEKIKSPYGSHWLCMDMDDVRISSDTNWDAFQDFMPSRYPWKDPQTNTVAFFEGEIPEIPGAIWGPYYSNVAVWKIAFPYAKNPYYTTSSVTIGEGNTIYGLKRITWERLWKDVTNSAPPKNWWELLTGKKEPKQGDLVTGKGSITPNPLEQANPQSIKYTIQTGTGNALWTALLDWYWQVYQGANPLGLPVRDEEATSIGGPISIDGNVFDYNTRKYKIKFRAPASTNPSIPLYQAPIFDDLTIAYQKKEQFLIYTNEIR